MGGTETDSEPELQGYEEEDQPQQCSPHSRSNSFSNSSLSLTPSFHMGVFPSSRISPDSDENNTDCQGPSPSQLQMIVHTERREKKIYFLDSENDVGSSQANPQRVSVSRPPASLNVDSKLQEVEHIVISLDSRIQSMDSQMQSMNSQHSFYEKMDKIATNVTSSQTTLETNLVRQLATQQYQLTNDLDFVMLQLLELVNHLKETGDAKKVEGGQHHNFKEDKDRVNQGKVQEVLELDFLPTTEFIPTVDFLCLNWMLSKTIFEGSLSFKNEVNPDVKISVRPVSRRQSRWEVEFESAATC
ncbi:hypothetical protein F511_12678 [Dorcoceras hygrometricum]|uniref:Uncharacterized protein n=1 Tax=Dorcoceras hygrometricum TaxID=472368 RepID=A0A2Z7DDY0_9LAMI|nr:hypothetical protein F511_12678 [Dorcoceras hygrometricum]